MAELEQIIQKSRKMLEHWQGFDARILSLTQGHPTLTVLILGADYGQNLVIHCHGPEWVSGPIEWRNCKIEIVLSSLKSGKTGITLLDDANQVRVTAESVEVKENVKY